MIQELEKDNLQEIVNSGKKVMVQYSASWCGNCRMIKPKFRQMAEEHSDIEFVLVDAEKYPESRQMAKVNNLPTFAAFENGSLQQQIQTNLPLKLKSFIDEVAFN